MNKYAPIGLIAILVIIAGVGATQLQENNILTDPNNSSQITDTSNVGETNMTNDESNTGTDENVNTETDPSTGENFNEVTSDAPIQDTQNENTGSPTAESTDNSNPNHSENGQKDGSYDVT